jgi:hypothetical protein
MNLADTGLTLRFACEAHVCAGQAQQAIATCEKATITNFYWWTHVPLVAPYGDNGDLEKVAAEKAEILRTCQATRSNCARSVIQIIRSV